MLPTLTDQAVLEGWLGIELDPERATVYLNAASAAVRYESGQTWVDAEGDLIVSGDGAVSDLATMITCAVAARMVSNPTGVTQTQTGPFAAMMSAQYMTDEERTQLRGMRTPAAGRVSGLGVINVTRGPLETSRCLEGEEGWVDVVYANGPPNAEPMPL